MPALKDDCTFTSLRGFEGVPTHGIPFSVKYVLDYIFERHELDRLQQMVDEDKSARPLVTKRKLGAAIPRERGN